MKRASKSGLRLAAATASLLLLSACVSEDAGYGDVRRVVSNRTGYDVRWRHAEGRDATPSAVRELLSKPLTADAAVRIALLNSPELQASFEELGLARAELVSALAVPNPVAEGAVRFRKQGSKTIELSVTEDVSELILLPLRNAAARAELDAAALSVAARALDLVLEVRSAFYAYLADRQLLELRGTVLRALEASAVVAKGLHDAGNLTELDLASQQVLYEEGRINQATAETALATSRERLNTLLGVWGAASGWRSDAQLAPPPAEPPFVALEATALRQSLDLAAIRQRLRAAAKRANLAHAEGWLPELKGGVTAEREESQWSYGPLAELELPLFYQGQGEVARAEAEMRRQRQLLDARAVQIRSAARVVVSRLVSARERALHAKDVLMPARARILQQTQLQFNAMNVSVFQLLAAKREQVETTRSYVEALRDYWIARAELEQLKSGRLPRGSSSAALAEDLGRASQPAAEH